MACQWENVQEPLRTIAQQIIAESGGKITCSSAFRTSSEQEALYKRYLAGKGAKAARPGSSRHEHGLAIDFGGDMQLLAQLAPKYGLFAAVEGEPWHWELGDGVALEGMDVNLPYEMGDTANPQEVIANRLNAALSMIGGASPTGITPPSYFDKMGQEDPVESGANQVLAGAVAGAKTGASAHKYGQYAVSKFQQFGWDAGELAALTTLWNKESGNPKAQDITWNPAAANPTSSARGIAQKMTSIHGAIEPTAEGQIDWGLQYIAGRYGSPSKALAFHLRNGWY